MHCNELSFVVSVATCCKLAREHGHFGCKSMTNVLFVVLRVILLFSGQLMPDVAVNPGMLSNLNTKQTPTVSVNNQLNAPMITQFLLTDDQNLLSMPSFLPVFQRLAQPPKLPQFRRAV